MELTASKSHGRITAPVAYATGAVCAARRKEAIAVSDEKAAREQQFVGSIGLVAPLDQPKPPPAPAPDETWHFGRHLNADEEGQEDYVPVYDGMAWVYYGKGHRGLERPVLMADGFHVGPSSLDELYDGFERGEYPLMTQLHQRGRDAVIFGSSRERSASILLDNAGYVIEAITRLIDERTGDEPLVVGGFRRWVVWSRAMPWRGWRPRRWTTRPGCTFSYDSPHRGASVPIGLQAFGACVDDESGRRPGAVGPDRPPGHPAASWCAAHRSDDGAAGGEERRPSPRRSGARRQLAEAASEARRRQRHRKRPGHGDPARRQSVPRHRDSVPRHHHLHPVRG